MSGAVDAVGDFVGDAIGGVGGVVSGVANQIPVIGPYVGPVVGGITGGPMGFATSLAGNALQGNYGGGGGSGGGGSSAPMYAQPNINYGNNTYSYGDAKLNASPYFITGDKGIYNLLPALGQINAGGNSMQYTPNQRNMDRPDRGFNKIGAEGSYTPYEAYNDIRAQMANDPKALAAFNKSFSPTAINSPNIQLPGGHIIPIGTTNTNSPMGQFYANNPNPHGQYVNFDLSQNIPKQEGLTYNQLANYAAENKNPFFLPYETTQGATPMGFTPSANALATVDTSNYLSGYNTARTAQNQYNRDQRQAQQAAQQAQQQARQQAERAADAARRAQRDIDQNQRNIAQGNRQTQQQARTAERTAMINQIDNTIRPFINNAVAPSVNQTVAPPVAPSAAPPVTTAPGKPNQMYRGGIAMLHRRV